jgi:archaellum biogenesis ATPase FlaH
MTTPEVAQGLFGAKVPTRIITAKELLSARYPEIPSVIGGGILGEGCGLILDGESGDGKSLLRTELAIHLALGRDCWGLEIPTARRVFIVQLENIDFYEQYRLQRMLEGLGVPESRVYDRISFHDRAVRFDLTSHPDRFRALESVKVSEAEIVIWDCLSNIHTASENDNVAMRQVLDTITWIAANTKTAHIVIHHFGKPSPDQKMEHRSRGASSIRDWCDTKISLTKKKHPDKTLRMLTFVKIRNGPGRRPILLERDEYFLHTPVKEEGLCPPEMVEEILRDMGGEAESQGRLAEKIAEQVSCSIRTAKERIKVAVKQGCIKEMAGGKNRAKKYVTNTDTDSRI